MEEDRSNGRVLAAPQRRPGCRWSSESRIHGILLLGGTGSRLRPVWSGNKHLIPMAGRTMAEHAVELLWRCGVAAITAVVPDADVTVFRNLFAGGGWPVPIILVGQPSPAGTADALERCVATVGDSLVMTLWGDNLFEIAPVTATQRFRSRPSPCRIQVADVADPRPFSTVVVTDGKAVAIEDKPTAPVTTTVCTGLMFFESAALFDGLPTVHANPRGERDVMDAVRSLAASGGVDTEPVAGRWLDAATSPESVCRAQRFAAEAGLNRLLTAPTILTRPKEAHR